MLAVYGKVAVCYQLSCFSAGQSETHAEYNAVQTGFQTSDQVVTSLAFHLACDFEQVEELLFAYTVDELQLLLFLQLHSVFRNLSAVSGTRITVRLLGDTHNHRADTQIAASLENRFSAYCHDILHLL